MAEYQSNMPYYLTKNKLIEDLKAACFDISQAPIMLHSDLFKIGLTATPSERLQICADYQEALDDALHSAPLLIPTFNYDFCKNGKYDRINSPSQVGTLSDYFRLHFSENRTYTPIFNFVIHNKTEFLSLASSTQVFGQDSLFAELHKQNGYVFFLGADFSSNTFLHYIEECNNIGYRYLKSFSGEIIDQSKSIPITVSYRVRPWLSTFVVYDWTRLILEATQQKILKQIVVGHGKLLYYKAAELFEFWSEKMKHNELYLLTPQCQIQVRKIYESNGYPLTLEMFE
ncbi:MAG: AAC(3) family N-acetyltransferase [Parachlamydiaceae bacterium]|nr:AAC(3) family N-acetyltransferase [Parachlamydiaceae bacterium]